MEEVARKLYLAGGTDANYLRKAMPYLETMNANSNVANLFFTLDFEASEQIARRFEAIRFVPISSLSVRSRNPNNCLQHGGFLEALDFVDQDAVIIFTDTDIKVQRGFTDAELKLMGSCEEGQVLVNLNGSPGQTLLDDAYQLDPTVEVAEIGRRYPQSAEFKVYNTGVIVANYRTYRRLYETYNEYWPAFQPLLASYVKQQWLLSYIIQKHFRPRLLPYTIHCHDLSPPYRESLAEAASVGYKFCIGSEVVVLNHHIRHGSHVEIMRLHRQNRRLLKVVAALGVLCVVLLVLVLYG